MGLCDPESVLQAPVVPSKSVEQQGVQMDKNPSTRQASLLETALVPGGLGLQRTSRSSFPCRRVPSRPEDPGDSIPGPQCLQVSEASRSAWRSHRWLRLRITESLDLERGPASTEAADVDFRRPSLAALRSHSPATSAPVPRPPHPSPPVLFALLGPRPPSARLRLQKSGLRLLLRLYYRPGAPRS